VIADNQISGNDVGVYQLSSPNYCIISQNTLEDTRFFGILIQDGDGTTSQNAIADEQVGIAVVADTANTVGVSRGDRIANTTVARRAAVVVLAARSPTSSPSWSWPPPSPT